MSAATQWWTPVSFSRYWPGASGPPLNAPATAPPCGREPPEVHHHRSWRHGGRAIQDRLGLASRPPSKVNSGIRDRRVRRMAGSQSSRGNGFQWLGAGNGRWYSACSIRASQTEGRSPPRAVRGAEVDHDSGQDNLHVHATPIERAEQTVEAHAVEHGRPRSGAGFGQSCSSVTVPANTFVTQMCPLVGSTATPRGPPPTPKVPSTLPVEDSSVTVLS